MGETYPGTTLRATRVPDDLWAAAKAAAEQRGETLADVIRRALREYVDQTPTRRNRKAKP